MDVGVLCTYYVYIMYVYMYLCPIPIVPLMKHAPMGLLVLAASAAQVSIFLNDMEVWGKALEKILRQTFGKILGS